MKLTQEKVDALSDEFQSTFTIVDDNKLANMYDVNEIETINELVKKHFGASTIKHHKTGYFGNNSYDMYVMEIN